METVINLVVPKGIEFISDWKDYVMPTGHCIVDKGVTGCGYTEMCLRNDLNVILCSPRRLLLENKAEQHKNDGNILYLKNELKSDSKKEDVNKLYNIISDHIDKCIQLRKPVKLMVTYDSTYHIINYLQSINQLNNYYLIADEFQSIFLDSFFKADVENAFVDQLQQCHNVIYLSATPMLKRYLQKLDEFKDLKYFYLDWSNSGFIENIKLMRKQTNSLGSEADKIVQSYLAGNFPFIITEDKSTYQSTEAVMFFNSVTEITRIIKRNGLTPEQCNILCSTSNLEQVRKVRNLGPDWDVGEIPLKGEQNKMFTFCTSACYVGSDFYSKCASTYVFADPNLKNLALDISLDLPQIAGRQRDRDNPFKNYINIFYKVLRDEKIENRVEFEKEQELRRKKTQEQLDLYYSANSDLRKEVVMDGIKAQISKDKYSNNFVSISKKTGLPVYNKFIELADERAWEVAQEDYQDSINVTKAFSEIAYVDEYKDRDDKVIDKFLDLFYSTGNFAKKMKAYCEFVDEYKDNKYIMNTLSYKITDLRFRSYYNFFGTEGCRARSYREDRLNPDIKSNLASDDLFIEISKLFKLGSKYTRKDAKLFLAQVYNNSGIKKIAKANDLEKWFEVKEVKFPDATGKWVHGFELLAIKKN